MIVSCLFLVCWLCTGILLAPFSYALTLGYFCNKPSMLNKNRLFQLHSGLARINAFCTLFSPICFSVPLLLSQFGKYGLYWRLK